MSVNTVGLEPQTCLPSPQERPDADIVIYDGNCRFCTSQVRRLNQFDSRARLAYLSLHDPQVAAQFADLTHDELMRGMVVVDQLGRRHAGISAVRYLSRRIPRLWWLAPWLHIPGSFPFWSWMYRQIADHRYLFGRVESCAGDACKLHDAGR